MQKIKKKMIIKRMREKNEIKNKLEGETNFFLLES